MIGFTSSKLAHSGRKPCPRKLSNLGGYFSLFPYITTCNFLVHSEKKILKRSYLLSAIKYSW